MWSGVESRERERERNKDTGSALLQKWFVDWVSKDSDIVKAALHCTVYIHSTDDIARMRAFPYLFTQ